MSTSTKFRVFEKETTSRIESLPYLEKRKITKTKGLLNRLFPRSTQQKSLSLFDAEEELLTATKHKYTPNAEQNLLDLIPEQLPQYEKHGCTEVLHGSKFPACSKLVSNNGLISTVVECYCQHHNLILRPDDIWTAIMTQFSFYINANAEKFRGKFVDHEGQKELVVFLPGDLRSGPYDQFVKLMSEEIDKNLVDPEVKSWILPNFSTTTDNDLLTCGVVFMASMKKYFTFGCTFECGIPFITLEGTLADWENILSRIDKLNEYEIENWVKMLKPILEQFVQAKKEIVDKEFWKRICDYNGGSGSPFVSGWITAFAPFDEDGKWHGRKPSRNNYQGWPDLDFKEIPTSIVDVEVKINDNGVIYYSSMFAGHMGYEILDDGETLKPMVGWVIGLKPEQKENGNQWAMEDEVAAMIAMMKGHAGGTK